MNEFLALAGKVVLLGAGAAVLLLHAVGLPANWILLGLALVYALATRWHPIGWGTLVALAVLAVLAEVLEFVVGSLYTARRGASRWGAAGAFLGGIAGAMLGAALPPPVVGVVVGAFLGSFLGAVGLEYRAQRRMDAALRSGRAAVVGRALGTAIKTACGFGMWGILAWRIVASS